MSIDFKTINVPQSDVNDLMSTLVEWHVSNNDFVNVGDVVCTMETSKLVFDVESELEGYVCLLREEGQEVGTLEPLVLVAESIDDLNRQKEAYVINVEKVGLEKNGQSKTQNATKKAIIKAKELGLDLNELNVDGVIKEKDVDDYFKKTSGESSGGRESHEDGVFEKKVKIIGNRKAGKDLMLESGRNIPPSYVEKEMDVTRLVSYVNEVIRNGENYITPLSIILYSLGKALLKHKEFNSFREDDRIVTYKNFNVGIVVNVENNLSIPVLSNIDTMEPYGILKKLFEIRKSLIEGKTNVNEFVGGTFTVSAMDHTSVSRFVPIIHPGQAAVLAVPKIFDKYGLDSEGNLAGTKCVNLGLSFDHTFLNAMQGIEFLDAIDDEINIFFNA